MRAAQLYRHYDKDGALLYVGIAYCAFERLKYHRITARWFKQISKITIEHFRGRGAARRAERKAIETENPRFNECALALKARRVDLPAPRRIQVMVTRKEGRRLAEDAQKSGLEISPYIRQLILSRSKK